MGGGGIIHTCCKKISGPEKICFKNAKLQSTMSRLTHNSGEKSHKKTQRRRRRTVVANLHLSLGNVLEGSKSGGVSIIPDASTVMHL